MTEQTVHPGDGADDDAKIWASLEAADQAKDAGEDPPADADGDPQDQGGDQGTDKGESDADAAKAAGDQNSPADPGTGDPAPDGDDPWAKAPEPLRAEHDSTRQKLEQTEANYRRVSGTVSGLQRKINDLEGKLKAKPADNDAAGGGQPVDLDNDPEIKAFQDEYGEVAKPVLKVLKHQQAVIDNLTRTLGSFSEANREQHIGEQIKFVKAQHEDYDAIAGSQQFVAWYEQAPPYIRQGIERNAEHIVDGQEVAHIVKMFKTDTGWKSPTQAPASAGTKPNPAPDAKRQQQLESAASPRGKAAPRATAAMPEDDAGIWDYWEQQDRRKGASR